MTEAKGKKGRLFGLMLPVAFLICFGVTYSSVFQKLMIRWSSPDSNFAYLIVPLCAYLCWGMRSRFYFAQFSWSAWALLPISFSVGMIVLGELGSVETLLYIGIWGCLVGLAVMLYGWRTKVLVFPLLVLFFIVPLPPFVNSLLTFKLKIASSIVSAEMLRATGVSVLREGNILDLAVSRLQVVDACSGLHSFMSMVLISIIIGRFLIDTWWQRTILLLLVLPLSILLNGFRIFVTGMLTVRGHPKLAESFFHDFSGWLLFVIAVGLLASSALILKKIGPKHAKSPLADPGGRSVSRFLPHALVGFSCLLFILSAEVMKTVPSAHAAPARLSFDNFPMEIGNWVGKRHNFSRKILDGLWADDYVSAIYQNVNFPNQIYLLIPFYEYQGTRHTAHAPQSCLLGSGWSLLQSDERQIAVSKTRQVRIATMILQKANARMLASYFFLQRGRVILSPWYNKFYLMYDSLTRGRTDGALVRVEMALAPDQSSEKAYIILQNFMVHLWPVLPEYVPM